MERRTRVPTRKAVHGSSNRRGDPRMTRQGQHTGSVVMAVIGSAFAAYAIDFGGLRVWVDQLLQEVDQGAHRHDAAVGDAFVTMLPILGILFLVAVGSLIVLRLAKPKKTKIVEAEPVKLNTVGGNEFIRPVRYGVAKARDAKEAEPSVSV